MALDHSLREGAGLAAEVLHRPGRVDSLGSVHTDQPDPFAAVQDEGVAIDYSGDDAGVEVGVTLDSEPARRGTWCSLQKFRFCPLVI